MGEGISDLTNSVSLGFSIFRNKIIHTRYYQQLHGPLDGSDENLEGPSLLCEEDDDHRPGLTDTRQRRRRIPFGKPTEERMAGTPRSRMQSYLDENFFDSSSDDDLAEDQSSKAVIDRSARLKPGLFSPADLDVRCSTFTGSARHPERPIISTSPHSATNIRDCKTVISQSTSSLRSSSKQREQNPDHRNQDGILRQTRQRTSVSEVVNHQQTYDAAKTTTRPANEEFPTPESDSAAGEHRKPSRKKRSKRAGPKPDYSIEDYFDQLDIPGPGIRVVGKRKMECNRRDNDGADRKVIRSRKNSPMAILSSTEGDIRKSIKEQSDPSPNLSKVDVPSIGGMIDQPPATPNMAHPVTTESHHATANVRLRRRISPLKRQRILLESRIWAVLSTPEGEMGEELLAEDSSLESDPITAKRDRGRPIEKDGLNVKLLGNIGPDITKLSLSKRRFWNAILSIPDDRVGRIYQDSQNLAEPATEDADKARVRLWSLWDCEYDDEAAERLAALL